MFEHNHCFCQWNFDFSMPAK